MRQTVGQYREIDADWLNISTTVLYPTASTQLSDLPAAIERKYKSALKVRYIEPNACAVLVGRTLEAACNHEKAQGKNLTQKLYFLANDGWNILIGYFVLSIMSTQPALHMHLVQ